MARSPIEPATPTDPSIVMVALTVVLALGHLLTPLVGIPIGAPGSTGALLVVAAAAAPFIAGAAVLRARPQHATAWLVPAVVVHLARVVPSMPSAVTARDLVVVLQSGLAILGVVVLLALWRSSSAWSVARNPTAGVPRSLLLLAGVASLGPLVAPVGFRTPDGPPLDGWWATSLAGADAGFVLFLAAQVAVVLAGLAIVARWGAVVAGTAALAWAGPVAVAGVVNLVEVIREPILVPLPLAVLTTVAALGTVVLGVRARRRPEAAGAVP
ncbi:MAG: hypothetical protein JJT89_10445 [Nitriliruptoraceae bacterium]|nr:hypothetical protein [Nitriliruptoraceae bacterium]